MGLEFSFINKPVIYISTDIEEYQQNRGIILDDYDFWAKDKCSTYKEFIKLIEISNSQNQNNNYINNKIHYNDLKDGGCKEICDFLFDGNFISNKVIRHKSELISTKQQLEEINQSIEEQKNLINYLQSEKERLNLIENSKGWKLLEQLRKIIR